MSKNILTKALLLLVGSALTLNLGCKPEKSNARNLEQIIKPYIESRKIKNIELSTDVDPLLKAHKDIKDVTSFDTNADTDVWMFYLDDKVISGNKIPFKDKKKLIIDTELNSKKFIELYNKYSCKEIRFIAIKINYHKDTPNKIESAVKFFTGHYDLGKYTPEELCSKIILFHGNEIEELDNNTKRFDINTPPIVEQYDSLSEIIKILSSKKETYEIRQNQEQTLANIVEVVEEEEIKQQKQEPKPKTRIPKEILSMKSPEKKLEPYVNSGKIENFDYDVDESTYKICQNIRESTTWNDKTDNSVYLIYFEDTTINNKEKIPFSNTNQLIIDSKLNTKKFIELYEKYSCDKINFVSIKIISSENPYTDKIKKTSEKMDYLKKELFENNSNKTINSEELFSHIALSFEKRKYVNPGVSHMEDYMILEHHSSLSKIIEMLESKIIDIKKEETLKEKEKQEQIKREQIINQITQQEMNLYNSAETSTDILQPLIDSKRIKAYTASRVKEDGLSFIVSDTKYNKKYDYTIWFIHKGDWAVKTAHLPRLRKDWYDRSKKDAIVLNRIVNEYSDSNVQFISLGLDLDPYHKHDLIDIIMKFEKQLYHFGVKSMDKDRPDRAMRKVPAFFFFDQNNKHLNTIFCTEMNIGERLERVQTYLKSLNIPKTTKQRKTNSNNKQTQTINRYKQEQNKTKQQAHKTKEQTTHETKQKPKTPINLEQIINNVNAYDAETVADAIELLYEKDKHRTALELGSQAIKYEKFKTDEIYNNIGAVVQKLAYKEKDKDRQKQLFTTSTLYFQKAIEINPEYAPAYCNMGVSYREAYEFKKAIKAHEKSIEFMDKYRDEEDVEMTYYHCGRTWLKMEFTYKKMNQTKFAKYSANKLIEMFTLYLKEFPNGNKSESCKKAIKLAKQRWNLN